MGDYDGTSFKHQKETDFGERKTVTANMLATFHNNDEYLYNDTQALWDTTPPVTRKRFNPVPCNELQSYSVDCNSGADSNNNINYHFSSKTSGTAVLRSSNQFIPESDLYIQFNVDNVKSTVLIDPSYKNTAGEDGDLVSDGKISLPYTTSTYKSVLNKSVRDYSPFCSFKEGTGEIISDDLTCNEYWYVSFDRERVYETRPNWLTNHENGEIPSICRAQTFLVNIGSTTDNIGELEGITLNLLGGFNTGSPLYVEITECENHGTQDDPDYYPASRNSVNNERYNTTEYGPYTCKQIACTEVQFENSDPGVVTIPFNPAPVLEDNTEYAVILRSPLTHQSTPYMVGGWSYNCDTEVYSKGDAFMSTNNGYNWIKYGKEDDNVAYHEGQFPPQDFAFICHIREYDETKNYLDNKYLYTEPVMCNPLNSIHLSSTDSGTTYGTITYEISTDGENWQSFNSNNYIYFNDDHPTMFILRAKLSKGSSTESPYITNISLHLTMSPPKSAVLRTVPFTPRTSGILASHVYSNFYAPYTNEVNSDCSVSVVRESVMYRHYSLIDFDDLLEYCHLSSVSACKDEIDNIIGKKGTEKTELIAKFKIDHKDDVLAELESNNIYILTYLKEDKVIKLGVDCAYPLLGMVNNPKLTTDSSTAFSEWLNYTVDYDTNIITLRSSCYDNLKAGDLTISYNPLFIKDLKLEEMKHSYTGDKGFLLDLIIEEYTVTKEMVEQDIFDFVTRTQPLDPLRSVVVNPDSDNITLEEDVNYSVNYTEKTVCVDGGLKEGDVVRVKYTPYLVDDSISFLYELSRSDTGSDVLINPSWVETKT